VFYQKWKKNKNIWTEKLKTIQAFAETLSLSVAAGKKYFLKPIGCSDGVKEKFQMVLAESVGQDISLSFKHHRNHRHQRVNVYDEAQDREEPSKANKGVLKLTSLHP
jgi:hypothetical protein